MLVRIARPVLRTNCPIRSEDRVVPDSQLVISMPSIVNDEGNDLTPRVHRGVMTHNYHASATKTSETSPA
jgi:hypothetical protein